jgi:hypothetical protein
MNKRTLTSFAVIISLLTGLIYSCNTPSGKDQLKEGFITPPDSARPGVYWYFMDGNLDRDAMTADLESMKKAGIGYVLFLEVNVGVPRGTVDFLSEEWQELYKHAVNEAERLGIRLILGSGPGWAGSGGPWVTPEQSMSHMVATDTTVTGPSVFNAYLSVPVPRTPFFGEGSLTPKLKQIRDNWFKDVVTLAFPAEDVPLIIDRADEKALYYRAPFTSVEGVLPYIPSKAVYDAKKGKPINQSQIIDISAYLESDGRLNWTVPAGKWTIMRFGLRNNGAVTRPAPDPGLGFESDKFDTASFDAHYDAYVGKLIKKVNPSKNKNAAGWTMIHIDSWEMGSQNWSPNFREEFMKRRGYDPEPLLPVYTGLAIRSIELSERFLWDVRQTSNELIVENHAKRFKDLGKRNNFRLSIEPYDMNPAADLDLGGVADVPMCEFWSDGFGYNSSFSCIEATSLAHTSGLPVVAAEAFTAESSEAWKKYPGNMKDQGDWAFCMGINRIIYHTFAHKPFPDKYRPGMTMGPYGVHWDRGQTWWPMAEAYHKYIARCQFVLSQGKAVSDILYLTPEGAPQVFLPPVSAVDGKVNLPDKKGYSFDGCSPTFLMKNATVKDGNLVLNGGASYKILVLPQIETMTPQLLEKLLTLVQSGATIVGNPPVKSPSLYKFPWCDDEVKRLSGLIWGSNEMPGELTLRTNGKGKIWCGGNLAQAESFNSEGNDSLRLYPEYETIKQLLKNAGVNEDFASSGSIRYTHRALTERDVYFISNRTDIPVTETCFFRDGSANAEIWNPVTGEINSINSNSAIGGISTLNVKFEPHQSFFIVFYHNEKEGKANASGAVNFNEKVPFITLEGEWNVAFDTVWGGPAHVVFDKLTDWTQRLENGIKYYSGRAVYTKSFDLPENKATDNNSDYFLDLGKLKNLGRVKLNGRDLGVIWTEPWQVKITGELRPKGNKLEIEVANLWINRLIGDENEPWDGVADGKWPDWLLNGTKRESKRFTFTTHHFYKKDDPLQESGLIGPVKILFVNRLP